ncbi:VOC family protein [Halobacillus campisalis]|uniref:VOC family protein n=1 Tax=Halobacillus campisalis TaxID=435909 RepID=A0ABW2K7L5_9BACI|nr:VOC family protein [Halobacillus campisalis]
METKANGMFVNLPVKDLNASIDFFTKLGFTFNPQFTSEEAACMVIAENMYAMLLVEKYFTSFTKRVIPNGEKSAEVILALSLESREEVDTLVNKAFEAGAERFNEPMDHGFMYGWSFQDLDHHLWEVFYMDESGMENE